VTPAEPHGVPSLKGHSYPKALLGEAQLKDAIEITVEDGALVIRVKRRVREGWAEAARQAHEGGEDVLLDDYTPLESDDSDWMWE
jgi:antitoxin component of MazEF toxin-antitoxin module